MRKIGKEVRGEEGTGFWGALKAMERTLVFTLSKVGRYWQIFIQGIKCSDLWFCMISLAAEGSRKCHQEAFVFIQGGKCWWFGLRWSQWQSSEAATSIISREGISIAYSCALISCLTYPQWSQLWPLLQGST